MLYKIVKHSLLVLVFEIYTAGVSLATVNIDTVIVGNEGNGADPVVMDDGTTGYGSVPYKYSIGMYEITNNQYCEFLNAKAKNDTYGLYSGSHMASAIICTGDSPNYTYAVQSNYENMPVIGVCWYDAVRFANWMTNGQESGDTESGSYRITEGGPNFGTVTIPDLAQRAAWSSGNNKHWMLPSEDEWYKAAYHKNDGVTNHYWTYATGTNAMPYSDNPSTVDHPTNNANYFNEDGITNGFDGGFAVTNSTLWSSSQNYQTEVGAYRQSPSPYGTFDQNGNAKEWTEAHATLIPTERCIRGGYWGDYYGYLQSTIHQFANPMREDIDTGFRLICVPEPAGIVLFISGVLGFVAYAWRRDKCRT